jgi:hypothetical protein
VLVAPAVSQSAHAAPLTYNSLNKIQKRIVSGLLAYEQAPPSQGGIAPKAAGGGDDNGTGADGLPETPPAGFATVGGNPAPGNYAPLINSTCERNLGANVKVNINCLNVTDSSLQGRGQANNETSIAQDPLHPTNLVASNNDYRRGDGTCGASYSMNGGASWQDSTVPDGFTRGFGPFAREYWTSGGDTSVAWDTRGNAYLSCQLFNRGQPSTSSADLSSAFVVFRSTGNNGASWNFPGRYVTSFFDPSGTAGVLEDKQLIAVDNHVNSPFRDRVYVTWTEFAADGSAYIWESHSSDYGETFSPRVLVSSNDNSLCTITYGAGTPNGNCNENQFSDPFVGPDGALYVAFANFNNPISGNDNRNQMLMAKSTDGGATFGPVVKVGDYYDLPDCFTYQGDDPGRACVPEKGSSTKSVFRATNYPSGAVNPLNPNQVVVNYGSYINPHSNENNGCAPNGFSAFGTNLFTGVKTPGACNNDIMISVSNNGGASFSNTNVDPRNQATVTNATAQRTTDQFWQWTAFNTTGTLAVSYMDRQYGADETTGSSDVTLSGSKSLSSFVNVRVTSSSMPAPTEFYGTKGGLFYGDYQGLTAVQVAYPIWSDTRNTDVFLCPGSSTGPGNPPRLCTATESNGLVANDQDVYTSIVGIPFS